MPSFSDVKYVYDPEALKIMGAAFDTVCQGFPPDLKEHEGARRRLALLILRHMDRGEHEVAHLRPNHGARRRQTHQKRRKPRVKALVKSKLESDREAKRNRDPSETPCYFFNCNYIEHIYSDDSCPNFPAKRT